MAERVPGRLSGARRTSAFRGRSVARGGRQFHGFRTRSADLRKFSDICIFLKHLVKTSGEKIGTCLEYFVALSIGRPVEQLPAARLRGARIARGIGPRRRHYRGPRAHHRQKTDDAS